MHFSKILPNAWYFIALTYLFALLPWTILTNLDFISSDWHTLKATRTSGRYHFCFVAIPIPIITFYIVVFWSAMNYPESCAAFLGLYVSFVHFLRTSWGLWQIRLFRSWAIGAIESMEEMGYEYKLRLPMKRKMNKEDKTEEKEEDKKKQDKKKEEKEEKIEEMTAEEKADLIFVNNTIIDNQMFHGETQCYLQYRGKVYCAEKDTYGDKSFFKRWIEALWITIQLPFLPLLWTFDLLRYEIERVWMEWIKKKTGSLGRSEKSRESPQARDRVLHLPFKPVDVWLRWSTAFVAQGLNEWIEEFEVAQDPDMKEEKIEDEEELYKARRDYFAGELLSGMSHLSDMRNDTDRSSISMISDEWDEKIRIQDGTIRKREVLRAACESGRGLPFGARQISGEGDMKREIVEGLEGEEFVGYSEYNTKLEWVTGSLPVKFGGWIREFDIERLEWLTILLYVGNMKKEQKKKKNINSKKENLDKKSRRDEKVELDENECNDDAVENCNKRDKTIGYIEDSTVRETKNEKESGADEYHLIGPNRTASSPYRSNLNTDVGMRDILGDGYLSVGSRVCPNERYMPFRNLMSQLGFTTDPDPIHKSSHNRNKINENNKSFRKICSFALNKSFTSNICMIVSRTNRHVLRVGEMSDIWIQLEAGKHYKFLQEKNEWWRTACLGTAIQEGINTKSELKINSDIDNEDNIGSSDQHSQITTFSDVLRERQERAELSRLMYQLGDGDQKYSHLEKSLSFMGYGMEFVRSELGHWVSNQNDGQDVRESWRPKIGRETSRSRSSVSSNSICTSLGLLSSSLSDSITRRDDCKLMHQRMFQVRLLWEIQQLLEEKIKIETEKGGGGPDSEAMIMHCILGFPALIVEIDDSAQGNGSHGTNIHNDDNQQDIRKSEVSVKNDKNGNCMIHFQLQQDKKTITRKSRVTKQIHPTTICSMPNIHVRPQCAPQDLYLWIYLDNDENCRVQVTAGIRLNDTKPDERFEWQWWRDSFCSRLQGTTKWQDRHQFPFVACDDTVDSINEGIENMKISEIGTGERLRVWNGWRPFRKSICRFELETPGYILENKKTEPMQMQWYFPAINTSTEFPLNRIEQVPVPYDRARWRELHTCFLSMIEILELSSHQQSTTDVVREEKFETENDKVVSNSERVHVLLRNGQEGAERAVLLLQETALKDQDQNSLHHCLQLMSNGIHMPKDLGGAIDLLHRFLTFGEGRRSQQEIVARVKILAEAAVEHTKYLWREENRRKDLFDVLQLVSVRTIGVNKIDEVSKKRLDWLLGMLRVRVMRHQDTSTLRFLAHAEGEVWRSKVLQLRAEDRTQNEKRVVLGNWVGKEMEDVNAYLESCAIYERAIKESDGAEYQSNLLNEFALQLEEGINGDYKDVLGAITLYERAIDARNAKAMCNLGHILQHGTAGIDKDPQKAQHLYQRAIGLGDAQAMNNLAWMLAHGAEGVEKDPQKAQHLYECAIDARSLFAMNNLAWMLQHGTEGFDKDPLTARHLYQRAIDAGNALAMYNLALMLEDGAEGVEKDPQTARLLYQRAIDLGNDDAMGDLAWMLEHGAEGVDKDPPAAHHLYQRAIDAGNSTAMNNLALMLEDGAEGVEKDPQKARLLYQRAIDAGNTNAMTNLAYMLRHGSEGIGKDPQTARHLYQRAIDAGNATAMNNLALMLEDGAERVEKDPRTAKHLYQRAIDLGNSHAMYNLACMLQHGAEGVEKDPQHGAEEGVTKDPQTARHLYQRASDLGNSNAMNNLALMLEDGTEGVEKDPQIAQHLYQRAIDLGNANAMYNLAYMLQHGAEGVTNDPQTARHLYQRAIDAGNSTAMNNLALMLEDGAEGVDKDPETARHLYQRAIDAGNASAMNNLAYMLRHGTGVAKDPKTAQHLYQRAIDAGNATAMSNLALMLEDDAGVGKDPQAARHLYQGEIDAGNVSVMYNLACMHHRGTEGVEKDPQTARHLCKRAIDVGNTDAVNIVACMLEDSAEDLGEEHRVSDE